MSLIVPYWKHYIAVQLDKHLDLSDLPALKELDCSGGGEIETLYLTGDTALERINCAGNKISNLDLTSCTALTYLYCEGINMSSLDLSHIPDWCQ